MTTDDKSITDDKLIAEALKREQKKLKACKRRHRALERSKGWAVFCFLCLLAVSGGISAGIFYFFEAEYEKEVYEQDLSYSQEYQQWENQIFEEYYGKRQKEKHDAAAAGDSSREDANAYISDLKRAKLGLEEEIFGTLSRFTNTTGYELSEYTIAGDSGNTEIFPGAVLKGDSLFQGSSEYTLLPLERTSMYLTSNQPGDHSAQVEKADLKNVSKVLDECAKKSEGQRAKEWNYYMQTIKSSMELEKDFGIKLPPINLNGLVIKGSGKGEGGIKIEVSSMVIIYRQKFYTVSAEPQKNAVEYFQNGVDLAAFGDYEPAYVSSVDYGRMVVVLVQGKMSEMELSSKVKACIEGVGIESGLTNIFANKDLTCNIFQYGGEQKDVAMNVDNSEKAMDFISVNAPAVNPVPIAYTLKYLTDNAYVPAMVISGRESLVAERDVVKKVTVTASEPVAWENTSEAACILVSSDDTVYEFLWDSSNAGILQGKVAPKSDKDLGEKAQLVLRDCLPNGKNDVEIGSKASTLFGMKIGSKTVTADVAVSAY